ncbi:MAG: helix-hairpin-helix domain-containing protein [Armatimonas sp.]
MKNPLEKLTRREQYGLTGSVVILVGIVLGSWGCNRLSPPPLAPTMQLSQAGGAIPLTPEQATPAPSPSATPLQELVVHVTGAVKKPGIYKFRNGQRLYEAVEKAGGFRADAAQEALNLADKLRDADRLNVPVKAAPATPAPHIARSTGRREIVTRIPPAPVQVLARPSEGRVIGMSAASSSSRGDNSGSEAPAPGESKKGSAGEAKPGKIHSPDEGTVNINTADESELQRLPGVGPAIAGRILSYRQEVGQFQTLEDLKEVKGIGEKTFAKLKPLITI